MCPSWHEVLGVYFRQQTCGKMNLCSVLFVATMGVMVFEKDTLQYENRYYVYVVSFVRCRSCLGAEKLLGCLLWESAVLDQDPCRSSSLVFGEPSNTRKEFQNFMDTPVQSPSLPFAGCASSLTLQRTRSLERCCPHYLCCSSSPWTWLLLGQQLSSQQLRGVDCSWDSGNWGLCQWSFINGEMSKHSCLGEPTSFGTGSLGKNSLFVVRCPVSGFFKSWS